MADEKKVYDLTIRISDDYYKAFLSIEFLSKEAVVKPDDIVKELKERNVIFGIKHNVIADICKEKRNVYNELVAVGLEHVHGSDALINYHVNREHKAKPQVLEDGRVDFKNMGFVEMVHIGDVLATKTPATKGKMGTTVTGKNIRGKDGKEAVLKIGKNVKVSSDGLEAVSEAEGTVVFDGDKIIVVNLLEIKGNVGVETGNIVFQGQVIINGNITNGYQVECEGDLIVNGVVEGATLKSQGNIVISRGIQGHNEANIACNGNFTCNFINSATVTVKGDIETGAIMNSTVKCDGEIMVKGKKGVIVGGEVSSKKNIEAVTVGSEMGIITAIKLGVDVEVIEELKSLTTEVKELIDMHDKLGKSVNLLKVKLDQNPDDQRSKFMYEKYHKSFVEMDTTLADKRQRLKMLNELINNIKGAQLKVRDVYPGTRIKIGNSNFYVKNAMKNIIFKKDRGEVVTVGY